MKGLQVMKRIVLLAICGALLAYPALADTGLRFVPLGCLQLTSLGSATAFTPPAGSTLMMITVEGQSVRMRDDGIAPTASVGVLLPVGGPWPYSGTLAVASFIQTTASATIDGCFYR
jgi:hypothetical protein